MSTPLAWWNSKRNSEMRARRHARDMWKERGCSCSPPTLANNRYLLWRTRSGFAASVSLSAFATACAPLDEVRLFAHARISSRLRASSCRNGELLRSWLYQASRAAGSAGFCLRRQRFLDVLGVGLPLAAAAALPGGGMGLELPLPAGALPLVSLSTVAVH